MAIVGEIRTFFDGILPGSSIEDDFEIIAIVSPARRQVRGAGWQPLVAELAQGRYYLVVNGTDPRPEIGDAPWERREVTTSTDGVTYRHTQHLAALDRPIDALAISERLTGEYAMAIISPAREMVLHVNRAQLHAKSAAALDAMVAAHPSCFR
jgi:hypothetical protein